MPELVPDGTGAADTDLRSGGYSFAGDDQKLRRFILPYIYKCIHVALLFEVLCIATDQPERRFLAVRLYLNRPCLLTPLISHK